MQTQAVEDYLKAVYELQRERETVATTALAARLGVTPASATGMIKKLAQMKLVTYEPYQGVRLTRTGRKIALEVIRHHRLIELYLAEALDLPWDRVHEEAEKWEHVLSEDLEERIDELLGHPTADPHGAPIPSRDGKLPQGRRLPLSELKPGQSAIVAEVSDHDPKLLRYLGELGLYPKTPVKLLAVEPFGGPLRLTVGGQRRTLGLEAARYVFVTEVSPESGAPDGALQLTLG